MDVRNRVRKFFGDALTQSRQSGIGDADSLLMNGLLDSLKMLDLVEYLENEFAVSISEDDLVPENFDSIDAIVNYLGQKEAARQ